MPSCPHTTHQVVKPIEVEKGQSISFCRGGCSRTILLCPKCGEGNRSLARFCRRCSGQLDYASAEAGSETSLPFVRRHNEMPGYPLGRHNVRRARALDHYPGFLFVVADDALFIFDTNSLHEEILIFRPADSRSIRGISVMTLGDVPHLLISTAESVYALSLLQLDVSGKQLCKVSKPSQSIYSAPLPHRDNFYYLEFSQSQQESKLIRFPDQLVVTSFRGQSQQPIKVLTDQILFSTDREILLYDTNSQQLRTQKFPEHLDKFAAPAYSAELETAFLVGENKLWRLSLRDSQLIPSPLSTVAFGTPRIAASDDKLFVARSNGLIILDSLGDIVWDSVKNFISASSDLGPPLVYKNSIIFTSLGRMGGSDVRIHQRKNPSNFELVSFDKRLACSPLLSLGRLIAVVGEDTEMELRVV